MSSMQYVFVRCYQHDINPTVPRHACCPAKTAKLKELKHEQRLQNKISCAFLEKARVCDNACEVH